MTTTTITEESIAPIIDAERVQNAARANPEPSRMIYDLTVGDLIRGVSVSAFTGPDQTPYMIRLSHLYGTTTHHLSLDDAKAMRDALTEAIKAREAAVR